MSAAGGFGPVITPGSRLEVLKLFAPVCTHPGATASDTQLVWWTTEPAEWRCRLCGRRWVFEPPAAHTGPAPLGDR